MLSDDVLALFEDVVRADERLPGTSKSKEVEPLREEVRRRMKHEFGC